LSATPGQPKEEKKKHPDTRRFMIVGYHTRPTTVSKETYYSVKRDLLQCQKRPTKVSKETYYSVKRDLLHDSRLSNVLSFITRGGYPMGI